MPGTMPAMNNWVMDTLATTPKSTKPIEGGMMGAMMPAEAMSPPARASSWLPTGTASGAGGRPSVFAEIEDDIERQLAGTSPQVAGGKDDRDLR